MITFIELIVILFLYINYYKVLINFFAIINKLITMRTLVVGDIHGNYKGFKQALKRSNFDYDNDTLISLGDLVDGHEESYKVIGELYQISNLLLIKGNHDEWFKHFIRTGRHPEGWRQGAIATAESYTKELSRECVVGKFETEIIVDLTPEDIPEHHRDLLDQQVAYIIDEKNRLFVHGGFNRHSLVVNQAEHTFYWDRDFWNSALSYEAMTSGPLEEKPKFKIKDNFTEVFLGHTSTEFWGTDKPMNAANVWNLDTGGGWYGRITIMDVDTKEYWQSDRAETLYPNFKGRR